MNVGANEVLQLTLLLCTIAGSWGVVRSNVQRLLSDLGDQRKDLDHLTGRADELSQACKVIEHQLSILSQILSPNELRNQNREIAQLIAKVEINTRDVQLLQKMHNGEHPPS